LPLVAHALAGHRGGNLLYANYADAAEKMAQILWQLEGPHAETADQDLLALITFSRKAVHPK
jgi:hypothetical protein